MAYGSNGDKNVIKKTGVHTSLLLYSEKLIVRRMHIIVVDKTITARRLVTSNADKKIWFRNKVLCQFIVIRLQMSMQIHIFRSSRSRD